MRIFYILTLITFVVSFPKMSTAFTAILHAPLLALFGSGLRCQSVVIKNDRRINSTLYSDVH